MDEKPNEERAPTRPALLVLELDEENATPEFLAVKRALEDAANARGPLAAYAIACVYTFELAECAVDRGVPAEVVLATARAAREAFARTCALREMGVRR